MRHRIIAALAGTALVCVAGLQAAPGIAASGKAPQPTLHNAEFSVGVDGKTTTRIDGKVATAAPGKVLTNYYNGWRFQNKTICQDNNIGATWPIEAAGNAFESGTVNPVLTYAGPGSNCPASIPPYQVIHYSVYNANDNRCSKATGQWTGDAPKIWATEVEIQMNNYYPSCKSSAQHLANHVSRITGQALGLAEFTETSGNPYIMNTGNANIYSYAGSGDRTNLYWLYN
ncbi:hypothetical protein GCM10009554_46740 [Kribbella koreensis]|uniref:Peptidase inhibitor family I36 n=3 Tax=Kribbellaceae TaxID=2726069 RepID=A0ABP6WIC7_9ACTN